MAEYPILMRYSNLIRQLKDVKPLHRWQRHLPGQKSYLQTGGEVKGAFEVHDTRRGRATHQTAEKLIDPAPRMSKWAVRVDSRVPFIVNGQLDKSKKCSEETDSSSPPGLTGIWEGKINEDGKLNETHCWG